jgi:hypothetical protein
MLGQDASSHTVTNLLARKMSLISPKREFGELALTRIQSGFFSVSPLCTTFTGMRETLSEDFCLTPGSYTGVVSGTTGAVMETLGLRH